MSNSNLIPVELEPGAVVIVDGQKYRVEQAPATADASQLLLRKSMARKPTHTLRISGALRYQAHSGVFRPFGGHKLEALR